MFSKILKILSFFTFLINFSSNLCFESETLSDIEFKAIIASKTELHQLQVFNKVSKLSIFNTINYQNQGMENKFHPWPYQILTKLIFLQSKEQLRNINKKINWEVVMLFCHNNFFGFPEKNMLLKKFKD